ncbi:TPA: hypothetical protein DCX66_00230 [Candidatus Nomurabacteria bacterium]|nr:hypothetical protein [Candidatus Nomurabacteria bacterium]HAX64896.1 hypothetical protein [Candidatus Nomurabacteria bacterium]HCU01647.1 hypothetical protein [Candidatus Nomurabacteria bacterium]
MLLFVVAIVTLTFCGHKKTVKQIMIKKEQESKPKKETPVLTMKSIVFIPVRFQTTELINSTELWGNTNDLISLFSVTLYFCDSSGTRYSLLLEASKFLNTSHIIHRDFNPDEIINDADSRRRENTFTRTKNFYYLIKTIPLAELRIETIPGKNEVFKIKRQRGDTEIYYPEIEELWYPGMFY